MEYERTMEISTRQMSSLFGSNDSHIRQIEDDLSVNVVDRDGMLHIKGEQPDKVDEACRILEQLRGMAMRGSDIEQQNVSYAIELGNDRKEDIISDIDKECICHTVQGKPVKPKTIGQKQYVDAMKEKMIVFGIGPAGTGKTYLAMAMAIAAYKSREVGRIILTRPAVEAGEKLGFLPGDLQNKVDPYLRPLYDALYDLIGLENYLKLIERGTIEIAPLAYMRGRTLDDSFIILDEAQNTTSEQMKMFLTRMGIGSKVVITGDITQIDLPRGKKSGLIEAMNVLKNIKGIEFVFLTKKDVVRHELVMKIVQAYDDFDRRMSGEEQGENCDEPDGY